jgi:hypothetical protein
MAVSTINNASIAAAAGISTTKLGAGAVLQVVSTTKTDTFSFATATPVDITGLSVSITPTSASNKILIMCHVGVGGNYWSAGGSPLNLVRNSTNILSASSNGYSVNFNAFASTQADTFYTITTLPIVFLDSPATTSATTYKLQVVNATGASTSYINRSVQDQAVNRTTSTITVMEIAA